MDEDEAMDRAAPAAAASGSSGRSRRSSTRPRSATARCWWPRRSTRSTRTAPRAIINEHPGVSHNYLRNHEFNLWFTIATAPDSKLGLDGTLDVLRRPERRRVDPQAAHPHDVQDQHEPGDGGRHRASSPPPSRRSSPAAARPRADRRLRRGRDPRAAGPDGGAARTPTRPAAERLGVPVRAPARAPRGHGRSASSCAAWRRSCFTVAPASRPTAWASGRCPRTRSRRSARGWPRSAACRTATAGPTYPDWPYSVFTMAHGRSKEECDAVLDGVAAVCGLSGDDRVDALLLDRVQEDSPALLHAGLCGVGAAE